MKIVFLGDIVGKAGRKAIQEYVPQIKEAIKPDIIIANAENSAHGFGISATVAMQIFDSGVDALTMGNHTFDNADIYKWIDDEQLLSLASSLLKNNYGQYLQRLVHESHDKVVPVRKAG